MNKERLSISEIKKEIWGLRKERVLLESYCLNIRKQLPCWLSIRYTYCKKGNCKCTRGYPHGPFAYIYFKRKDKVICRYIRKKELSSIRPYINNYHSFQENLAKLRKINERINFLLKQWQKQNLLSLPK